MLTFKPSCYKSHRHTTSLHYDYAKFKEKTFLSRIDDWGLYVFSIFDFLTDTAFRRVPPAGVKW